MQANMGADFFDRIDKRKALVEGYPCLATKRHWGTAITLDANTRINVLMGEPSAHFHRIRTEEYILYSGAMTVYRGENIEGDLERTVKGLRPTAMKPGDKIVIAPGEVHIPIKKGKGPAVFIEISHGPYEDNDIVRIYDKTARDLALAAEWAKLGYKAGTGIEILITQTKRK